MDFCGYDDIRLPHDYETGLHIESLERERLPSTEAKTQTLDQDPKADQFSISLGHSGFLLYSYMSPVEQVECQSDFTLHAFEHRVDMYMLWPFALTLKSAGC